jgi:hypothetical protein
MNGRSNREGYETLQPLRVPKALARVDPIDFLKDFLRGYPA